MRPLLVLMHRWMGLLIAAFLFIAGLTGSVIAWDHELDEWLNPQLFKARGSMAIEPTAPLELARHLEATDMRLRVSYVPLHPEAGHTVVLGVAPRIDAQTGEPFRLGFNQVAVDPATQEVQGTRQWGQISLSRENLLPFLYKLHYTLHIPRGFGIDFGVWVMGIVSTVWILDCLVALWVSFPSAKGWRKSFAFRLRQGSAKMSFDLHRSGGVWLWGILLMLAVTSVSLNLGREVMKPVISIFSTVTPTPFETRKPSRINAPIEPILTRERAIALAVAHVRELEWDSPPGEIFYAHRFGLYGVSFFAAEHDRSDDGMGNPWIYVDGITGQIVSSKVPGSGSAGDIFMQAQLPLHSGRILGLPGRILISIVGLAVATLSVTGVIIWARKRRAAMRSRIPTRRKP